ncbi:MAG: alanine racemase [Proteobacteria bacterium]|nr:MAG: alanine racemase [Pseudomonadota bacterium]
MTFPCASIDADALRDSLAVVRSLAPRSRVMAVVKANAYGHGLIPTARALAGADAFGVARLSEGVVLREAGITAPIVVLGGVSHPDELGAAARMGFELVVHSPEQIALLDAAPAHRFPVWLKLDTGMNRLGFRPEEYPAALQRLETHRAVGQIRLMTHLANAELPADPLTVHQMEAFQAAVPRQGLELCIANSAAVIGCPAARVDWVRPGGMLYGLSPIPGVEAAALGLRPAMTLTTRLVAVRRVAAGETVGYGATWRAARESRIGIAAIGYGDGYPRHMRNGAPVLVGGCEAPLVGRVSMDMIAVDVTDLDATRVGDEVTLWGAGLPAERVAACADTIAYELVCGVSQRVTLRWRNAA